MNYASEHNIDTLGFTKLIANSWTRSVRIDKRPPHHANN